MTAEPTFSALLLDLGTSDLCAWPGLVSYAQTQAAHLAIGAALALVPRPVAVAIFGGWIAKEIGSDLAGCPTLAVAIDSSADLLIGALGYVIASQLSERAEDHP